MSESWQWRFGMARKREQRLRRKARAALRAVEQQLAKAAGLAAIGCLAIRYVDEIYAPNLKEPFSIANRRAVDAVRAYRSQRAPRRAA